MIYKDWYVLRVHDAHNVDRCMFGPYTYEEATDVIDNFAIAYDSNNKKIGREEFRLPGLQGSFHAVTFNRNPPSYDNLW